MHRRPFSPTPATAAALILIAFAAGPVAAVANEKKPGHALQATGPKGDTCKSISGTMQVRILSLRNSTVAPASALSRGLQTVTKPIFGGTSYGTDPVAERAADLKMLDAYNMRLVEKNCASFDLAAALAPGASGPPRPTIPAAGKAAPKP